jgi:hypothetical protein
MSESKKDKKNKNLNEKDVEKISGGKKAGGCLLDPTFCPQLLYGGPQLSSVEIKSLIESLKKIRQEKKTSNSNEVKNLQPFSDEDKN